MSETVTSENSPSTEAPQEESAPVESKESSNPPPPAKKKFKYKADGAEVEEELDDSEVASRLSLAKAAHKRMQEAANTSKQFEQFMKVLKERPAEILSHQDLLGANFRKMAEEYLIQQLEQESMTPEQRAQADRDRRLADLERQDKERKESEESRKNSELENHYRQEYEKTIISALESSNLPKNEKTIKRMAELMQKNISLGLDMEPKFIAQLVQEDYLEEHKHIAKDATAEQLIALLGDDVINKIRKHDLSKFKPENPKPKPVEAKQDESRSRMTPREYTEYLKSKFQ